MNYYSTMDEYNGLFVIGVEHKVLHFPNYWSWLVNTGPVETLWKYQPTYLISQAAYLFGGVVTLLHAIIRGGRLPYLWLAILLHGFVIETMSFSLPDIDNYWHGQTPLMFQGRRLPLHILLVYPCFVYSASIAVAKLRLPSWAEPFAVGLCVLLIDIPYDIVSINFLHYTWHDTDPNIADRNYWVPWNSYYFHACFHASFTFWFHFTRRLICKSEGKWLADKSVTRELICTVVTSVMGTPGGILLFVPLYHPLHDIYNVHSEITFFIIFTIFLLIVWSAARKVKSDDVKPTIHWSTWLLVLYLVLHYSTFLSILTFFKPENEISIGLKEPIGPCDEYITMKSAFGMILKKRKYLCATDYDEKYFDWSCLPKSKAPSNGSIWYTACGVPLPNKAELISIVSIVSLAGVIIFGNLHFRSHGDSVFELKNTSDPKKSNKKLKKY